MTNSTHTTTPPLVMQAKGLVKRYGQVTALDGADFELRAGEILACLLYTSPSPRDRQKSRMPSSA